MIDTALLAVCFGAFFFLLLLIIGLVIFLRGGHVPEVASQIFRAILAVSAGAFGWIIGGQIASNFNVGGGYGECGGGPSLGGINLFGQPTTTSRTPAHY
jgi:hypothetical protein